MDRPCLHANGELQRLEGNSSISPLLPDAYQSRDTHRVRSSSSSPPGKSGAVCDRAELAGHFQPIRREPSLLDGVTTETLRAYLNDILHRHSIQHHDCPPRTRRDGFWEFYYTFSARNHLWLAHWLCPIQCIESSYAQAHVSPVTWTVSGTVLC